MRENSCGWVPHQWRASPPPLAEHVASLGPGKYGAWWAVYGEELGAVISSARCHLRPGGRQYLQSGSVETAATGRCAVCRWPLGRLERQGEAHDHCARNVALDLTLEERIAAGRLGCILSCSRRGVEADVLWIYWSSRPVLSTLRGGRRGGVSVSLGQLAEWRAMTEAGLARHLGGHEYAPADQSITGWLPRAAYSQEAAKRGGQCLVCREMISAGDPAIFRPGGYGRRSGIIHPACSASRGTVDRVAQLEAELAKLRGERL